MKKTRIALVGFVLMVILAAAGWIHFLRAAADEAFGMAIIEDIKGDRVAVEPTSGEVWNKLVELRHSKEEMWIGGIVEVFIFIRPDPNYPWGFRFKSENITVAEVTAEGLQTTIRDICENVDYWIRIGQAYVLAKVVEIHKGGDSIVELEDFWIASQAFGSTPDDSNWNPNADINDDNIVELADFWVLSQHFGESW